MTKIGMFVPFFLSTDRRFKTGFIGGMPIQAYKMAKEFVADSCEVLIVTLRTPKSKKEEMHKGIKIIRVGNVDGGVTLDPNEVKVAMSQYKPDVVVQFYVQSGMGEEVLKILPEISGRNYVRFCRGDCFSGLSDASKLVLGNSTSILINRTLVADFLKYVPRGSYVVRENTVSLDGFYEKSLSEKLRIRKKFGIRENVFVVLFVGRFVEGKGIDDLITALREIPEELNILGLFVGDDVAEKLKGRSGYAKVLKRFSRRFPDRFKVLGPLFHERMPDIYNLANLFCLPSKSEGLSNALLEAEACCLDRLVSNIPENIRFGVEVIENLPRQIVDKYVEHRSQFGSKVEL